MEFAEYKVRVRIVAPGNGWKEDGPPPIAGTVDMRPDHPEEWDWTQLLSAIHQGLAEDPVIIDYWMEQS